MKTRSVTFSAGMGRNDGSVLWGPGSGYCHSWHHDIRDTAPGTRSYFSWRPPSQIPLIIIHPLFHSIVCLSCHYIQCSIDCGRVDRMTKVRVLNCDTEGRSRIMHQLGCNTNTFSGDANICLHLGLLMTRGWLKKLVPVRRWQGAASGTIGTDQATRLSLLSPKRENKAVNKTKCCHRNWWMPHHHKLRDNFVTRDVTCSLSWQKYS